MRPVGRESEDVIARPDPPSSPRAARHGLPPRHFDALAAGGGGAVVMAHLWDAERSHRLLLLGLMMAKAADRPDALGPLSPLEYAWELLVAAEQHSRAVTDELLLLPETGIWLKRLLPRLRDDGPEPDDEPPLWVHTGQLYLVAAASAIRTGLGFSLRVPARSGRLWFPTLGRAVLPGLRGWQTVEVTFDARASTLTVASGSTAVRILDPPGRAGPGWRPSLALTLELPDGPRRIAVNDDGPYRLFPVDSPPRFETPGGESLGRWSRLLNDAWSLLERVDPQSAEDVAACLRSIEPLPAPEPYRWHSASLRDAMGAMAASEPTGAESAATPQFAATLTHEMQHSKLGALMHMYSLHTEESAERLYAPWRDDPRPLRGLLQGVYAFTAVARFWRGFALSGRGSEQEMALAQFEFALRRRQLLLVLPPLCRDPELTAHGRRLVEQLTETVARWEDDVIAPACRAEAERAVDDHAVSWRLHHLTPEPSLVDRLVRDWRARVGHSTPRPLVSLSHGYPAPRLTPDAAARNLDARTALRRMRVAGHGLGPGGGTRDGVDTLVPGVRPADLLLLAGDSTTAHRLYAEEISGVSATDHGDSEGPRSASAAWAGLRLALEVLPGHRTAARALLLCPELVRDVHRSVRRAAGGPVDPTAVAAWVGGAMSALT